jgi:hypothetical protein
LVLLAVGGAAFERGSVSLRLPRLNSLARLRAWLQALDLQ